MCRCRSHRMWQCQTPAFVITTDSPETNENHAPMKSDLIERLGGWWDGRQVCPQEDDSIWQPCNHMWMWGKADPGSTCAVRAHCIKPGDHTESSLQHSAVSSVSLHSGSDNLISRLFQIESHSVCRLHCWKLMMIWHLKNITSLVCTQWSFEAKTATTKSWQRQNKLHTLFFFCVLSKAQLKELKCAWIWQKNNTQ